MKKKKSLTVILTLIMAILLCVPVFADDAQYDTDSAGNMFASGDLVTIKTTPFFGGFAFGKSIMMSNAEAAGSFMAAGQEINVSNSTIEESLYIAGNNISTAYTEVYGNIYAAGNSVIIGEEVSGNGVYAAGSSIVFSGTSRCANLAASSVTFDGYVDGDVHISADKVTVTENAVVTGTLEIESANEPDISDSADVGEYSFDQVDDKREDADEAVAKIGILGSIFKRFTKCIYWIVAMAAFGMLLCWLFNDHLNRALTFMKERPGAMIGCGIISWLCIPLAAIILLCTYILAPIGGMLMLLYVLLLCAGLAFTASSLARLVFPKMNVFLSTLIGIAVFETVRMIPFIGFLVGIVADMYLLAYVVLNVWDHRMKKSA